MALELMTDDTVEVRETDLPGIPQPDPDVVYTVRKLPPHTHREILKRHTRSEFVRGVGRQPVVDTDALTDDLIDHVVVEWRGIQLRGEPAPCTRELKVKGLDWERKKALLDRAGANESARAAERRAESFPATA